MNPDHLNSFLNELKLLQQIPKSWRMPIVGLAVAVVVLLLWIVFAVRSELPPEMTAQQIKEHDDSQLAAAKKVVPKVLENPVTDLFNPPIAQTTEEQRRTNATNQVDNILITMFVAYRCGMLPKDEYDDTYQMLITYARYQKLADTLETANTFVRQRVDTAGASYSMVYGQNPCDRHDLKEMRYNLTKWRESIRLMLVKQM